MDFRWQGFFTQSTSRQLILSFSFWPLVLGNGLNLNNVARLILLTSSLDPWIFTLGKNKGSQPYLKSLSKRIENVSNCSFFRPFVQIFTHSKRPECEVMNIFSTSPFRPCGFLCNVVWKTICFLFSCFTGVDLSLHKLVFQLNRLEEAINDCTQAIELDHTYLKAYIKRARWLVVLPS